MRLFVAVGLPPEVVADLEARVKALRDDRLRWTSAESWHITLAFYGELADRRLADLGPRLERAARRYPPMTLGLGRAGRFDGRALWVACTGDAVPLRRLARSVQAAGRRVGAPVDDARRFRPHVTLARSSRPADLRPYVAALGDYQGPTWTADELALMQSELGIGEGARPGYRTVATYQLGPSRS